MTRHLRPIAAGLLLSVLASLLGASATYAGGCNFLMADRLLSRKGYDVHLISNLPEEWVRTNVIRNVSAVASNGAPELATRLKLHPIADLGGPGATWKGLLPFDPLKKAQTILVLDGATLTEQERAALQRLRAELFGQVMFPREEEAYWIAQSGGGPATAKKAEGCHQLLVVAPTTPLPDNRRDDRLLRALLDELWAWPGCDSKTRLPAGQPGEILDKNGVYNSMAHPVRRVVAATNDPEVEQELRRGFAQPYDVLAVHRVDPERPEPLAAFVAAREANIKLVALNWNGEKELTPEFARQWLPGKVVDDAVARPRDPRDLSGWQQFCRETRVEQAPADNGGVYQTIVAPTTRHVIALLRQQYRPEAKDAVRVPQVPGDLSPVKKLAVGPYFVDKTLPRERLLTQLRLEEMTRQRLSPLGVEVVTNEDIGALLAEVLVPGAQTPFADADSRQRVVSAARADALLVLYAQDLSGGQASEVVSLNRRTPDVMGPFPETKPHKADNCQHLRKGYCAGCLENYRRKVRDWEERKAAWEEERRNLKVTWYFEEIRRPAAKYVGDLRLIDLAANRPWWSIPLTGEDSHGEISRQTVQRTVTGDETPCPPAPPAQPPSFGWTEPVFPLAQEVLVRALERGLNTLVMQNLFAGDLKPWNVGRTLVYAGDFVVTMTDGAEHRGQLGTPCSIMENGQRVELTAEALTERLKDKGPQALQFAGGILALRTADGDETLPSSAVASIKLPEPEPVTARRYVVTMGAETVTGPLLLRQRLAVQTKLGERALTPEEIETLEEITIADTGATVRLAAETITGTIAAEKLSMRVGDEDRTLDWKSVTRVALDVPPPAKVLGFELQDGTKRNGTLGVATIPVAKYTAPLRVADISRLLTSIPGSAKVIFEDGSDLSVTFLEPTVKVIWEGETQPVALAWKDVRAVGPEFPKTPPERVHKVSKPCAAGGVQYAPLSDLMAAVQTSHRTIRPDGAAYVITLPKGPARFKAGDACVYVGASRVPLDAKIIVREKVVYFPVTAVKALWGYECETVPNGFRCTKGEDVVLIETTP